MNTKFFIVYLLTFLVLFLLLLVVLLFELLPRFLVFLLIGITVTVFIFALRNTRKNPGVIFGTFSNASARSLFLVLFTFFILVIAGGTVVYDGFGLKDIAVLELE